MTGEINKMHYENYISFRLWFWLRLGSSFGSNYQLETIFINRHSDV